MSQVVSDLLAPIGTDHLMPEWLGHLILVIPPIFGLVWTLIQWAAVKRVRITTSEDSDDESSEDSQFLEADERTCRKMSDLSDIIAKGAKTFLFEEYMYMAVYIVVFSIIIIAFYVLTGKSWAMALYTALAFVIGAITSIICGYIGMAAAVMANVRTAFMCWREGHAEGLRIALRGGSIMGFGLCSIGVLVLYGVIMLFRIPQIFGSADWMSAQNLCESLAGFGLGGSSIALFGRVGGGIYTKAADVGADLSGKNEYGMEEDDPRNPACIADNVGDNVGDIAGMGADLFGSFAESTVAALVIASKSNIWSIFVSLYFPLMVSSAGILVGILTMILVLATLNKVAQKIEGIETALKLMLIISTILMTPVVILLGYFCLPTEFLMDDGGHGQKVTWWGCVVSILMGLWCGLLIGLVTEYYTSHSYKPVRKISLSQAQTAATGIIYGLALGYKSCIIPVFCLAAISVVAHILAGMYGIALAALGMLSTLTLGLTIDGYGPISDNAGGIAEMAGLDPKVREYTDALDAAGNTTAAIGKGFAIGSAALVAIALFGAFKVRAGIEKVDVADPWTFAGLLLGALLPYWFSALTMKSVGKAAQEMVEECMAQFPKIISGEAEPDYDRCISISTRASLKEMIAPGLLVILSPLVVGVAFGENCTAGLLCGALVSGVQLAISMSNSGGAWDNSKKFIKSGGLKELLGICAKDPDTVDRWTHAHKNSVTGDTVGDPLKDTSGPSLNILVKLSAITSLVFASVISWFSSPSGGPLWLK